MTRKKRNYDFCYATDVNIDVITRMNKKNYVTDQYYNLFGSYVDDIEYHHEQLAYDQYEKEFFGSFILIKLTKDEMLDIATIFLNYN